MEEPLLTQRESADYEQWIGEHIQTVYFAKTTNTYEKVIPAIYRMSNFNNFHPSGPTMVCIQANLKLVKFYRNFSQYNFENLIQILYEIIGLYPATLASFNRYSTTSTLTLANERIVKLRKHHPSWNSHCFHRGSQLIMTTG